MDSEQSIAKSTTSLLPSKNCQCQGKRDMSLAARLKAQTGLRKGLVAHHSHLHLPYSSRHMMTCSKVRKMRSRVRSSPESFSHPTSARASDAARMHMTAYVTRFPLAPAEGHRPLPVTPMAPPLPPLSEITTQDASGLEMPANMIRMEDDVGVWKSTKGYQNYLLFLHRLSESSVGHFLSDDASPQGNIVSQVNASFLSMIFSSM